MSNSQHISPILYVIVGTRIATGEEFIPAHTLLDIRSKHLVDVRCRILNQLHAGVASFEVATFVPIK